MAKREMSTVNSLPSVSNRNEKHAKPLKGEDKNKIPNSKRVCAAKSLPHNTARFPSASPPEIRMPFKSAAETSPRQLPKFRKNQVKANEVNRLLVTINVLGSAGALRFLARCDDPVQKLIKTTLKSYAREGRLPVIGLNTKQFELHSANNGCGQALDPSDIVGVLGSRNFLLCKKHECELQQEKEKATSASRRHHQKSKVWKNWLNSMSLSFGVSSH